jgi:small subunit ribosomal protein S2
VLVIENESIYPVFLEKSKGRVKLRLNNKPDLIFIVNPNESSACNSRSEWFKIPVIALVDSNTNLDGIQIPIPVNYDTMFWVYHCVNSLLA